MLMIIGRDDKVIYEFNFQFKVGHLHYFIVHSSLDNVELKKKNHPY